MEVGQTRQLLGLGEYRLEKRTYGQVKVSTQVTEQVLNIYGKAHGGYLFALCDEVSGLTSLSTGVHSVTLQSDIHYLRGGDLGDELLIEGSLIHDGRQTKLIETSIFNSDQKLLAKGTFTMFVTGKS